VRQLLKDQPATKAAQPHARISDDRVEELLKVAAQVFAERGFDGASVNEMAKRANASKGTFYSRYPTKEALLMAVMGQKVQGLETELSAFMAPNLSVQEALTTFADRMLSVVLTEHMLANYRVVTLEARRFPELGKMYYENGAGKIAHFLAGYLERKVQDGKLKIANPQISAELFIDSIIGMPRLKAALGISILSRKEKAQRIEIAVETFLTAHRTGK
jgi:TetR/AcrR family transcriptional repressor of mexJK operon